MPPEAEGDFRRQVEIHPRGMNSQENHFNLEVSATQGEAHIEQQDSIVITKVIPHIICNQKTIY